MVPESGLTNPAFWSFNIGPGNPPECPPIGVYPTMLEFQEALGYWAIGLYIFCALVLVILTVQYGYLIGHFFVHVDRSRQVATLWVTSVYAIIALFALFTIMLPKVSDFVWLFYRLYLGLAMSYFVKLTMDWYGGETAMLGHVGKNEKVNFRVRPCCCLVCCPTATTFNKNKIQFMKLAVFQIPYIQGTVLFLMILVDIIGYLDLGNMSPASPYIYLLTALFVSFFFGMWGLFAFTAITKRYKLLVDYRYNLKSMVLKLMVILVNAQSITVDILARYGFIPCLVPSLSSSAVGTIIKAVLALTESLVLGTICYRAYIKDTVHL